MRFDLKADFEKFVHEDYEPNWQLFDQTLYALCDTNPAHSNMGAINAKLWLIGRALASGVERHIPKSAGQGSALDKMAAHLYRNAKTVHALIQELRGIHQPLELHNVEDIVEAHGQFCQLVSRIGRSSLTSFASKYLHYHAPAVPIYDAFAYGQAWRRRCKEGLKVFEPPKGADGNYYAYCLCFWQLYSQLRDECKPVTVTVRLTEGYLGRLAWLTANGKSPSFTFARCTTNPVKELNK